MAALQGYGRRRFTDTLADPYLVVARREFVLEIHEAVDTTPMSSQAGSSGGGREATRLLSESMDHPLPWSQRWSLWIHVLMCRYCSRFKQHLTRLRSLSRQYVEDAQERPDSPALSPEARQRIKKRLSGE
jgi:hypothetical protein